MGRMDGTPGFAARDEGIVVNSADLGLWCDTKQQPEEWLRTGASGQDNYGENGGFYMQVSNYRAIYLGCSYVGPSGTGSFGWPPSLDGRTAGHFVMAPNGIGYLLHGNYIGDARIFYCPTAGDSMPADQLLGNPADANRDREFRWCASKLNDLKRAGGFDAHTMSHGDWDGCGPTTAQMTRFATTTRRPAPNGLCRTTTTATSHPLCG